MSPPVIVAFFALLTTGCVVTSGHLARGDGPFASQQWSDDARVKALPAHSRRIAEIVLATDAHSVRRRHLAARPDQAGWVSRLTDTLPALKRGEIPLEAPAAFLVRGLPLELAYWLTIAEYHWQVGGHGHTVKHRSTERGYAESSQRGIQNQAIRQVLRFQVGKDVICASQRKVYGEVLDRPLAPATDLVTAYRRSQGLDPDAPFGVRSRPLIGQVVMQVFELANDLIRVEVHQGIARSTTPNGESVDTILVCSMPKTAKAATLGKFRFLETSQGPAALFRPTQAIAWAK